MKGVVSGTAAGVHFEQPVELAAHEDRTVVFTPEQFPQLHIHDPKLWWPYQMGEPHLEHLDLSFSRERAHLGRTERRLRHSRNHVGVHRQRQPSVSCERQADSHSRRQAGRRTCCCAAMTSACAISSAWCATCDLNTIRLEGKLDTEEFFHLADRAGNPRDARLVLLRSLGALEGLDRRTTCTIATASLRSQMLRLRQHASLLVWLNGSDNPPPANVENAYLQVEAETHWPNPSSPRHRQRQPPSPARAASR